MNTSCQKKKNDYRFLMRRVGVHRLLTEGRIIKMALVEIDHGVVVRWNTFTDEQPFTEWLGGTMEVVYQPEFVLKLTVLKKRGDIL